MAHIMITPEWAKLIDFETIFPVAMQHLIAQPAQIGCWRAKSRAQ
jgi:hypothetical protein